MGTNLEHWFLKRLTITLLYIFFLQLCLLEIFSKKNEIINEESVIEFNLKNELDMRQIGQDHPALIQKIRDDFLIPLPLKGPVILSPKDLHHGKDIMQQEIYRIIQQLLGKKKKGFFIECGALDGNFLSNSLSLELNDGWSGLLVEADPKYTKKLINRNRKAWILPSCLSPFEYPTKIKMKELKNKQEFSYLSEIGRILDRSQNYQEFEVQCFPLYSILKAIGRTDVDYFSLDVDGTELLILKSIPWERVNIMVLSIGVTNNTEAEITAFMESVGYNLVKHIKNHFSNNNIFIKNKSK